MIEYLIIRNPEKVIPQHKVIRISPNLLKTHSVAG
jgi:hypothetical protein